MKTYFKRVKKSKKIIVPDVERPLGKIASYMGSSTLRKIKTGIRPGLKPLTRKVKGSHLTLRDSGVFQGSIKSGVNSKGAYVGSNHVAAKMHQYGGRIVAKKRALWIPASAETRELQRKISFDVSTLLRALKSEGYSIYKSRSGKTIMAKEKAGSKPFALFILRKSVKIPARKWLYASKTDKKRINEMWRKACNF